MNLDEIIDSQITFNADLQSRDEIKDCMREAVKQALELAAERAEVIVNDTANLRGKELFGWEGGNEEPNVYRVDKQSILSIIDEIEE